MTTTTPVIGWERETPVPNDYAFNDYLNARNGRLFYEDLDLAGLMMPGADDQGPGQTLPSPLEIVYLPMIRRRIDQLRRAFADAAAEVGYPGRFHYAYASKANTAEEVVRTVLLAGAHYEMSSVTDINIATLMRAAGYITPERMVIANGFKPAGTDYARYLLRFRAMHDALIPVVEDFAELPPLIEAGLPFDVGLRQKTYGQHASIAQMDAANSRFGFDTDGIFRAAEMIASAPNLRLKMHHAMIGSQLLDPRGFVAGLAPAAHVYARLRQRHPDLSIFNFGGGMPVAMTLDFQFDYRQFARQLMLMLRDVCAAHGVPPPDIMGEMGRYTTAEHGAHLFKIASVKENGSPLPWYLIDGSIMSAFPDTWALGEHFIVLPLNHLDKPFRRVQLGGMTCDSDDVYPPRPSRSALYLPVETSDLYIGFFGVGAYQEMLGGVRGSKHCSLPEAYELIVDRHDDGRYQFEVMPGQTTADVMRNLGYVVSAIELRAL